MTSRSTKATSLGRIALGVFVAVLWAAMLVDLFYEPTVSKLQSQLLQAERDLREAQDRIGAIQYQQQRLAITCENRRITTAAYAQGENDGIGYPNE